MQHNIDDRKSLALNDCRACPLWGIMAMSVGVLFFADLFGEKLFVIWIAL